MEFEGEVGWVTHNAFPASLKSETTWLLQTLPKCHSQSCMTTLMALTIQKLTDSSQRTSVKASTFLQVTFFFSIILDFKIGCFLSLEPVSKTLPEFKMMLSSWEDHYRKISKPQTHKLMSNKGCDSKYKLQFWQILLGEEQTGC